MTQAQLEALLGRSLSTREVTNLALYLEIAKEQLSSMLCLDFSDDIGERVYTGREGYRTTFTGVFNDLISVKIDGQLVDSSDYYPAFLGNRNLGFYNSIVFTNHVHDGSCEVTIDASWGFDALPKDFQLLLAQAFSIASSPKQLKDVKSKKVEDFSITYGDLSEDETFAKNNAATLKKYSMCNIGYILHGRTKC